MPLSIDELEDNILNDILSNIGIGELSTEKAECSAMLQVSRMSAREAFDRFLTWHGIIGYSDMIINALDCIRRAEEMAKDIQLGT